MSELGNDWRDKYHRLKEEHEHLIKIARVDAKIAGQLQLSIAHNARLVSALRATLVYIDSRIITIEDARAGQLLLSEINEALQGGAKGNEKRSADGDAAGATSNL